MTVKETYKMQKYAIIVAGGKGNRMQSETPKQFLILNELPILMHTIRAFYNSDATIKLITVLPNDQINFWKNLVKEHRFNINHDIVAGGASRFDSVKNGLDSIKNTEGLVAIHDGARPLITSKTISSSFIEAEKHGNAIVCIDLKDSLRHVSNNKNKAVNRSEYKIIQTPQTFALTLIKDAFRMAKGSDFTDDASVLEKYGKTIHLVNGDYSNLKITTPSDLRLAESILNDRV